MCLHYKITLIGLLARPFAQFGAGLRRVQRSEGGSRRDVAIACERDSGGQMSRGDAGDARAHGCVLVLSLGYRVRAMK